MRLWFGTLSLWEREEKFLPRRFLAFALPDDGFGFRIDAAGAPARHDQRFGPRFRLVQQDVDTGEQAARLLQGEPLQIALADLVLHGLRARGIDAQAFERGAAE